MDKSLLQAIAILVGTTIGAGVFALPLAIQKLGFFLGFFLLFLIMVLILILNLSLAIIIQRTKKIHQLPGYAEIYIGKKAKKLMAISLFVYLYGAITAYLVVVSESLAYFLLNLNILFLGLIYFLFVSFLIYLGIKTIGKSELFFAISMFLIFALISFFSITKKIPSFDFIFTPNSFFISYGIMFFAFFGLFSIPEMAEVLIDKKKLKKAILIAVSIVFVFYVLFSLSVVNICGTSLNDFSPLCLKEALPNWVGIFVIFMAILAMTTSFLTIGQALKETYMYDFGLKKTLSFFLACIPSFVFFVIIILLNVENAFEKIISITGSLAGGLTSILVLFIFIKSKKKQQKTPEFNLPLKKPILLLLFVFLFFGVCSAFLIFYQFFK